MEQRRLKRWEIGGFFAVSLFGILLHFLYDWSGENAMIGIFGAVNESVWEHLKLLFMPVLAFTVFEYVWIGESYPNLLYENAVAVILGMGFLVVFYYTYTGIWGDNLTWLDIGSYFVSVLIFSLYSYQKTKRYNAGTQKRTHAGILIFIAFFAMFAYFTFFPPAIGLFAE